MDDARAEAEAGPLAGLTVVDLTGTLPGAFATQFLADAGADVIAVEPPGGSPMRSRAAWPALGRGKRSIVLDLSAAGDRADLDRLLTGADVLVTSLRPATGERLGLTYRALRASNPRLVVASITGWGSGGPWADLKGYEGLVMAKTGGFHAKRMMAGRPGPAFVSVPFASWGAGQTALHGILTALWNRESSGLGQQVEADLVRGIHAMDTWQWFTDLIGVRWPDAFEVVDAFSEAYDPAGPLIYPLLVAPTKDGHWLQFAQVEPRLFQAMMAEFGLLHLFADPKWAGLPVLPTPELRIELWEIMLELVSRKTLAEWQQVFDTNPDLSAEIFRDGGDVLNHPQLVHDGRAVTIVDDEAGPVRQPSTLVHVDGRPLTSLRRAPRLDEHASQLRAVRAARTGAAGRDAGTEPATVLDQDRELPLKGVTVLEFGLMFAAPFGATLLTDLGARVFKIESLAGDTIRRLIAFPEAAGIKVMQGKESIALDLATDEGRAIVRELAKRSDLVLQGFRAGAAERAGVDAASLKAVNPDLVYVNAPGYGTDGPYGHRPAYAPSIGAAGGLALTDAPAEQHSTATLLDTRRASARLFCSGAVVSMQADGVASLAVASTLLLGLLARRRGRPMGELTATMLATTSHANIERVIDYTDGAGAGRPPVGRVDADFCGWSALYRMYRAAGDTWVMLAAPAPREWEELASALVPFVSVAGDERFVTAAARSENDEALIAVLGQVFATRPAADWERDLTAAGVGLVEVYQGSPQTLLQTDPELVAEYGATTHGPILEDYLRLGPLVKFSRSATQTPGFVEAGQQTEALLREIGYSDERIKDLYARNIVTG